MTERLDPPRSLHDGNIPLDLTNVRLRSTPRDPNIRFRVMHPRPGRPGCPGYTPAANL